MTSLTVSTVVCDGHPLFETLAMLAEMGVRQVEPAFIAGYVDFDETSFGEAEAARLRLHADGLGLTLPTLSAHCDLGQPDAPQMLHRRIAFAAGIGARVLICNVSTTPLIRAARRAIEDALPLLERTGVVLALENPGHGQDEITGSAEGLAAFARGFGTQAVRANLDLCNIHTYSQGRADPEAALDICRDILAAVHLKEVRTVEGGWQFCAIGEGEALSRRLIGRIGRLGPEIALGLELPLRLTRPLKGPPQRAALSPTATQCASAIATSLKTIEALRAGV